MNLRPKTLREAWDRIAELEQLLETAQNGGSAPEWRYVATVLGVSPSQAMILIALSRSSGVMTLEELDAIMPDDLPTPTPNGPQRLDPDFRSINSMKQQVYRIRRRYASLLAPPMLGRYGGVALSPAGQRAMKRLLDNTWDPSLLPTLGVRDLALSETRVGGMG